MRQSAVQSHDFPTPLARWIMRGFMKQPGEALLDCPSPLWGRVAKPGEG